VDADEEDFGGGGHDRSSVLRDAGQAFSGEAGREQRQERVHAGGDCEHVVGLAQHLADRFRGEARTEPLGEVVRCVVQHGGDVAGVVI